MNIYIYMSTCTRIGVSKTGASFIVPFEIAPGADRYEHRAERWTAETISRFCEWLGFYIPED